MLSFLITFFALTVFRQCPLFTSPHAAISCSETYHPSSCLHHSYYHDVTYDSFLNLNLTLDDNVTGSIWHLYYVTAGHKNHVTGCMPHNPGCMTHNLVCLTHNGCTTHIPGCLTQNPGCMT